jgi:hypothetical protein
MKIKNLVKRGVLILVGVCALIQLVPSAYGVQPSGKLEVLKKARSSYYSLKNEGMAGFKCEMTPNWAALLEDQRKADPAKIDNAIARLKQLHFFVDVGANGAATVTHTEIAADNQKMSEGLKQVYSGMEQMTTGFFQTWSVFVVTPPLPDVTTEFQLKSASDQHSLSYKDGNTDVLTLMGRDFAVSNLKVTAKDFVSILRPRFTKTSKGYLLNAYDADYQGSGGKDKTELYVTIDYQAVESLQLPQKLNLKGSYNTSPFQVEVTFFGCTAVKR